jgi:hypothetical protein
MKYEAEIVERKTKRGVVEAPKHAESRSTPRSRRPTRATSSRGWRLTRSSKSFQPNQNN